MKLIAQTVGLIMLASPVFALGNVPVIEADNQTLAELVTTSARACSTQSTLQIPMLDWAGDFVAVHGNGGLSTKGGSIFDQAGISADLYVEDNLAEQVTAYLRCDTPFLRVTQDQAQVVAGLTEQNPDTQMVGVYQHSFSAGGDWLVSRTEAKPTDMCDSTIAIMKNGPHMGFMGRLLSDASCDVSAMTSNGQFKFYDKLSGENSPYHAILNDASIDMAFVVTPDMLRLVEEGELRGAHKVISTGALNTVTSDVWVVRRDYFLKNRPQIEKLVNAMMRSSESMGEVTKGLNRMLTDASASMNGDQEAVFSQMAKIFPSLKSPEDAGFFWLDADISNFGGQNRWSDEHEPRGWNNLNTELRENMQTLGLITDAYPLAIAGFDYATMTDGIQDTSIDRKPTFDSTKVAELVDNLAKTGNDEGELFAFEIYFQPNQKSFPVSVYEEDFAKIVDLSATYGGSLIVIEGHSDPSAYRKLRFPKSGSAASPRVLKEATLRATSLSAQRSMAAMKSVLEYADQNGKFVDRSQFATEARGISEPATGICDGEPCPIKTRAEWESNRRVVIRLISVPAESDVFVPDF